MHSGYKHLQKNASLLFPFWPEHSITALQTLLLSYYKSDSIQILDLLTASCDIWKATPPLASKSWFKSGHTFIENYSPNAISNSESISLVSYEKKITRKKSMHAWRCLMVCYYSSTAQMPEQWPPHSALLWICFLAIFSRLLFLEMQNMALPNKLNI